MHGASVPHRLEILVTNILEQKLNMPVLKPYRIHHADCLDWLRSVPDNTFDSCVTDPPYGLGKEPDPREVLAAWLNDEAFQPGGKGFMGKSWDAFVPSPAVWRECLRVLKPGGHLVAFASTRTYDWMALGVRLAGFEVRDMLQWLYGQGFPKGGNIEGGRGGLLKPACEPMILARKPFKGTLRANIEQHGTGALEVNACRVNGRWPANVLHDGSEDVLEHFPEAGGGFGTQEKESFLYGGGKGIQRKSAGKQVGYGDSGTAARFFYCAKASKPEREVGLEDLQVKQVGDGRKKAIDNAYQRGKTERRNVHPTVKPKALMRWIMRLVTPPGGRTFDPFLGSGTSAVAAIEENFRFDGCEREAEYIEIANKRAEYALREVRLLPR